MSSEAGKERVEHNLALKVMRLTRPTLGVPAIVQTTGRDIDRDILSNALQADVNTSSRLSEMMPGELLVLPQSFGNIYLGETFSSYVCVHNDSTEVCSNVVMRADLQTATQRINLVPGTSTETINHSRDSLAPGSTIDQVIHHEVKELGTHILVCEVNYSTSISDKMSFRKFFKFQVMKPLDVKTKFYNAESDEVFLEAQVQNITQSTITMDKVTLEPSHTFTVSSLTPNMEEESGIVGRGECLQVNDAWQYLFCLKPRPEHNNKNLKLVTNIGKLDIVWRTGFCDRGRLQTSQLQRLPPSTGDIKLNFLHSPMYSLVDTPFPITIQLENNSDRTMELDLSLSREKGGRITWTGVTEKGLGLLEPGGQIQVNLEVVLHQTGLQNLSGIQFTDTLLKRSYQFDDLSQVFVVDDSELYKCLLDNKDI